MEKQDKAKREKQSLRMTLTELKWMYGYAKKYKHFVLIYLVIGIVGTVMSLLSALATKYLIDAVTGMGDMPIVNAACFMVGMTFGNIASKAICSRIGAKISVKVQNEIQYEIYECIMGAEWEALNEYRSGDLLNRLNSDVSTVANGVITLIPSLITYAVQFIGSFLLIMHYDYIMALIALATAPVTLILSKVLLNRMSEYSREMRKMSSDIMAFQDESFQNLESVKSFGISERYLHNMVSLQDKYKSKYLDFNSFSIKTSVLMGTMGSLVSFACMGWGVYRLWSGIITFGTMTLFLQLASRLSSAFSQLVSTVPSAISALASAGRIMPVSEIEQEEILFRKEAGEIEKEAIKHGVSVEFKDVSFAYKAGSDVLKNISIKANPGEIVAIVGPSGEGKTTLIRLMLSLVHTNEGTALVKSNGKACKIGAQTRKLFSYVPQGNTVLPGSIADNMRIVKENASDSQIKEALETACAYEFVEKMPNGINSQIGEQGKGLSEGQAQRISIARAVIKDAPILLLDEATSALDIATERRVLKNIIKANPLKTCIVTTHRPSVLSMCDRVYKVENTGVIEIDEQECERMLMDF